MVIMNISWKENDYENGHDYYEHLSEGNITLTVYKSSFMDWWSLVGEGGSPRPLTRAHYIVKGSCCGVSTPGRKPPAPHQDL